MRTKRSDYYHTKRLYKLFVRPNVANAYTDFIGYRKCSRNEVDNEIIQLTKDNLDYTFFAIAVR